MNQRIYIPIIEHTDFNNRSSGCYVDFWGFDCRKDKNGQSYSGFFCDIKNYDKEHVVTIYYPPHIEYIGWTDEHARIVEGLLRRKQQDIVPAYVYKINHSELLERFYQNSDGIFNETSNMCFHYQIMTDDDIIDVIATSVPHVFTG
jgi:hypothetical protein